MSDDIQDMQESLQKIAPQIQGGSQRSGSTVARNGGSSQPASFIKNRVTEALNQAADRNKGPADDMPGMPPNMGQFAIPAIMTIQGIANAASRTYRISDEALLNAAEDARFMLNDLGISECIEARNRSVALLNWHLEPEDENSQEQKDLADELKKIVSRIPRFMQWREVLSKATWHGRYAIQHRIRWNDVGGRQRVLPTAWSPINGDKLVFRYDDGSGRHDPDQIGIRVGQGYRAGDYIRGFSSKQVESTERGLAYFLTPAERTTVALHKHMVEDGTFENPNDAGKIHGVGIRSRIYWEWFQKQNCLAWVMEYLERSAAGIEIWYYPWGNKEAEAATRDAAQNRIGNNRNIILVPKPLGDEGNAYGVDHVEPGLAGVEMVFNVLDKYFGHRIKRYVLGQTLTSEADATGLGSGLAELHLATFLDIVKYDATNLEETITTDLIEPIKNWNFPAAKKHRIKFVIETQSTDAKDKLDGYRQAWEMGARIRETDVMEAVGAAIATEQDAVLQSPQFTGVGGQDVGGFGGGGNGWAPSPAMIHQNQGQKPADAGGSQGNGKPNSESGKPDDAQQMADHLHEKLGGVRLPGQVERYSRRAGSTLVTTLHSLGRRALANGRK